MKPADVLVVINPPGGSGGVSLPVWIAVVAVILVVGMVLAIRRRR
jgi:hypothetical protein